MTCADRRKRSRTGFSLLELMIALVIGGMLITSVYTVGSYSSRQFSAQQQLSDGLRSLRGAMAQIKRDVARAGYLSTPNASSVGQSCATVGSPIDEPGGSGRLAGFSAYRNHGTAGGLDFGSDNRGNGFTTDDIVLFGNYETSDEYPGVRVDTPNDIGVSPNWHAFRRDFNFWYTGSPANLDRATFQEVFTPGRLIRIQTNGRARHYARISGTSVTGSPSNIQFAPGLPGNCAANGGWVAPVSAIRYFGRFPIDPEEDERFKVNGESIGQLIRMEVDPGDKVTALAGGSPARSVLDYLARFKLSFTMTTRPGPNPAPGADLFTETDVENQVNANPERIRAVTIDLAVRMAKPDVGFRWNRTGCSGIVDPLRAVCFQISDKELNAARVRRMRATVLVPNVAYEDL